MVIILTSQILLFIMKILQHFHIFFRSGFKTVERSSASKSASPSRKCRVPGTPRAPGWAVIPRGAAGAGAENPALRPLRPRRPGRAPRRAPLLVSPRIIPPAGISSLLIMDQVINKLIILIECGSRWINPNDGVEILIIMFTVLLIPCYVVYSLNHKSSIAISFILGRCYVS